MNAYVKIYYITTATAGTAKFDAFTALNLIRCSASIASKCDRWQQQKQPSVVWVRQLFEPRIP